MRRYGVVCYFRDVSNHVRARNALQEADRQKDEFLAMLAHELRNPLAPIQNASTLLAAITHQEPRAQFSVGVIKRQVTQLTWLVDDLLVGNVLTNAAKYTDPGGESASRGCRAKDTVGGRQCRRRRYAGAASAAGRSRSCDGL